MSETLNASLRGNLQIEPGLPFVGKGMLQAYRLFVDYTSDKVSLSLRGVVEGPDHRVGLVEGFVLFGQFNPTVPLLVFPHANVAQHFEVHANLNPLEAALRAHDFEAHVVRVKALLESVAETLAAEGKSDNFRARWDELDREVHSGTY